jgi:hypothetical protein
MDITPYSSFSCRHAPDFFQGRFEFPAERKTEYDVLQYFFFFFFFFRQDLVSADEKIAPTARLHLF